MKSLFMPLILSIFSSRIMELVALWNREFTMALVCRIMIWCLLWVAYHFKNKKEYTDELALLLYITFVFDTGVALSLRGIVDLYSWLTIYIEGIVLVYIVNRETIHLNLDTLYKRIIKILLPQQQQQQQQQDLVIQSII